MVQLHRGRDRAHAMRLVRALFALIVVASMFPLLSVANATPEAAGGGIAGTLKVSHVDDFKNKQATYVYALETEDGDLYEIEFNDRRAKPGANRPSLDKLADQTVTVRGTVSGKKIHAGGDGSVKGTGTISSISSAAKAIGPKKTAVILFDFPDLRSKPWTPDAVRQTVFTGTTSLNAWTKENSADQMSLTGHLRTDGDVFGWYELQVPTGGTSGCNATAGTPWIQSARDAAAADGFVFSNYDHVIYAFPFIQGCYGGGWAWQLGTEIWTNGNMNVSVLSHELGHNIGAQHGRAYLCGRDANEDYRYRYAIMPNFTDPANCYIDEYADPFDTMGGADHAPFPNPTKKVVGYGGTDFIQTATGYGSYQIVANKGVTANSGLKIPRPSDPSHPYYIDFKEPNGLFDDWGPNSVVHDGVAVRLYDDNLVATTDPITPYILDMTPWEEFFSGYPDTSDGEDYERVVLEWGRVYYDPFDNFRISATKNPTTGIVTVNYQPGPAAGQRTTATVSGTNLAVGTAANEPNLIQIRRPTADQVEVYDMSQPVTPQSGCTANFANSAFCPLGATGTTEVNAATGDDLVREDVGSDVTVKPGPGNDRLIGNGSGAFIADYSDATAAVNINLAPTRVGRDTLGSGIDAYEKVNGVIGTQYDDTLRAESNVASKITGGRGLDTIYGSSAADTIYAADLQQDTINCGSGTDTVHADDSDVLTGCETVIKPAVAVRYGDLLIYGAQAGQANNVTFSDAFGGTLISSQGAAVVASLGCVQVDSNTVLCERTPALFAQTGDGNDTITNSTTSPSPLPMLVRPGTGADTVDGGTLGTDQVAYDDLGGTTPITVDLTLASGQVTGGAGTDTLKDLRHVLGSPLADTLRGTNADDKLEGGGGNDTIDGRYGNDLLNGGDGTDTLRHDSAGTTALTVNLGNTAAQNTGQGTDTISNIENLVGNAGNDTFTGTSAPNVFTAGAGDDSLTGLGGADSFSGEGGADRIYADDGIADTSIVCGLQSDIVVLDARDTAASDCETRTVKAIVERVGNKVSFIAQNGVANRVVVTREAAVNGTTPVVVTENTAGAYIVPGTDCQAISVSSVRCFVPTTTLTDITIDVNAGDGADNVDNQSGLASTIIGGLGIDTLTGGTANDTINGNGDGDTINGGDGNDSLFGDAGTDTITGGAGFDTVDGGTEDDSIFVRDGVSDGQVVCGGGKADKVQADLVAIDGQISTTCESITRS